MLPRHLRLQIPQSVTLVASDEMPFLRFRVRRKRKHRVVREFLPLAL